MKNLKKLSFLFSCLLLSNCCLFLTNCGRETVDLRSKNQNDFARSYKLEIIPQKKIEGLSLTEDEESSFLFKVKDSSENLMSFDSFEVQAKMKCCGMIKKPRKILLLGDDKKTVQVFGLNLSKGPWIFEMRFSLNGDNYTINQELSLYEKV